MLSVNLLALDAIINNLTNLLCREEAPVFFDLYWEFLDHLLRVRRTLCAR